MEKSFLEGLGLAEDVIGRILEESDRTLSNTQSVSDADLTAARKEGENLKEKLREAEATIERLEKSNQDNKALQADVDKYRQKAADIQRKADADRVDWTIDLALERAGAINPATVRPLLDMNKIVMGNDGVVAGVDEQIQSILADEANSFLFRGRQSAEASEPEARPVVRGGYEPMAADAPGPEKPAPGPSLGAQAAEHVRERRESIERAVADFWSGKN